jgi:hypothetical protein
MKVKIDKNDYEAIPKLLNLCQHNCEIKPVKATIAYPWYMFWKKNENVLIYSYNDLENYLECVKQSEAKKKTDPCADELIRWEERFSKLDASNSLGNCYVYSKDGYVDKDGYAEKGGPCRFGTYVRERDYKNLPNFFKVCEHKCEINPVNATIFNSNDKVSIYSSNDVLKYFECIKQSEAKKKKIAKCISEASSWKELIVKADSSNSLGNCYVYSKEGYVDKDGYAEKGEPCGDRIHVTQKDYKNLPNLLAPFCELKPECEINPVNASIFNSNDKVSIYSSNDLLKYIECVKQSQNSNAPIGGQSSSTSADSSKAKSS